MIIQCEGCAAKYFLPDAKAPAKPLKVRCPQCRAVFQLLPLPQNVVVAPEEPVLSSAAIPSREASPSPHSPAAKPAAKTARRTASRGVARDSDRAKRLARVLVSDILCYNQNRRDRALVEGNLMEALSDEIKKSWELYKDKVGADVANSTDFFKEALNEILADGQKVF